MSVLSRVNPYRPGSEEWHYHNLTGGSWGHVEEVSSDSEGVSVLGHFYAPETLQMSNMTSVNVEDMPWELRLSPSMELIRAFNGFGASLERTINKIRLNSMYGYSIHGRRELTRKERLRNWLYRKVSN